MKSPFRKLALLQSLTFALGILVYLSGQEALPQTAASTDQKAVNVPAGTLVVLRLASPLNTESAKNGSGVYAETLFPVIVDNHVVIPARTLIQGTVRSEKRGGRFDRKSVLQMHFTNLVVGSSYTMAIDGALESLPGAESVRVDGKDAKRTDQLDKALPRIATGGLIGALFGSVRHTGVGTWPGAAIGAGLGLGSVLIIRGDAIHLPEGTKMEMVLNAPVTIDAAQMKEAMQKGNTGLLEERGNQREDESRRTPILKRREAPPALPGISPLSLLGLIRR